MPPLHEDCLNETLTKHLMKSTSTKYAVMLGVTVSPRHSLDNGFCHTNLDWKPSSVDSVGSQIPNRDRDRNTIIKYIQEVLSHKGGMQTWEVYCATGNVTFPSHPLTYVQLSIFRSCK